MYEFVTGMNEAFYRKISISRKNALPLFTAICCPDIHSTPQPAALDGCGVIVIVVGKPKLIFAKKLLEH